MADDDDTPQEAPAADVPAADAAHTVTSSPDLGIQVHPTPGQARPAHATPWPR